MLMVAARRRNENTSGNPFDSLFDGPLDSPVDNRRVIRCYRFTNCVIDGGGISVFRFSLLTGSPSAEPGAHQTPAELVSAIFCAMAH